MFTFCKMYIMVIVPAGHGINYFISLVHYGSVDGINQRSSACGNKNFRRAVRQSFFSLKKLTNSFPKHQFTIGRRIGSISIMICSNYCRLKFFRNWKFCSIKIANGIVVNVLAFFYFFFDGCAKTHNF